MVVDKGRVHPRGLYRCWGGTRDMPMHVVHDKDKGVHMAGMYAESHRWMRWGSVGRGLWRDEGCLCGRGREAGGQCRSFGHNVCHPTHKTKHTASGKPWADSLATEHHVMEVQTT